MTEERNPILLKLRKTQANEQQQQKNLLLDYGQNCPHRRLLQCSVQAHSWS